MRLSASFLSLAIVASAPAAFAQGIDDFGAYGGMERRGLERSPQEIAFEIRVGPYNPNVDDDLGGTPYEDTFGGKQRWHGGFEVDWQGLRIPQTLSLGPGFGAHYTSSSAKAPLESGEGRSAQDTTLTIVPLHLVGVLRVDALADRFNIPFCPYAKLGFGYAFWWSNDGDKTARRRTASRARTPRTVSSTRSASPVASTGSTPTTPRAPTRASASTTRRSSSNTSRAT